MTITARKPTQRALADWRTTWAARSGVNSSLRTDGGDVNRSAGARSSGGRIAGSRPSGARSSGSRPGVSVIGLLDRGWIGSRAAQMQPVGVRGGMMPGWPRATGSGPSVIFPVSIDRTPPPSTVIEKRSMPRGAGPNCAPSALMPRRS